MRRHFLQAAFIGANIIGVTVGTFARSRLVTVGGRHAHATAGAKSSSRSEQVDFQGVRVALAWHGIYQRHHQAKHGLEKIHACSDYFNVASNVDEMIVHPLQSAGASVMNFVHTYRRYDCPRKDQKLIKELNPVKYDFWNVSDHRIVDSYIEVLRMVKEHSSSVDFVVLLRFDVRYKTPITQWSMTLDTIGVPFMDLELKWLKCSQVSDLLFTLPIKYIDAFIDALDWSGNASTSYGHTVRGGYREKDAVHCDHKGYHGSGHFVWQPLFERLGRDALHVMDPRSLSSDASFEDTETFLGIDRTCSDSYFSHCRHANDQWVNNGLW